MPIKLHNHVLHDRCWCRTITPNHIWWDLRAEWQPSPLAKRVPTPRRTGWPTNSSLRTAAVAAGIHVLAKSVHFRHRPASAPPEPTQPCRDAPLAYPMSARPSPTHTIPVIKGVILWDEAKPNQKLFSGETSGTKAALPTQIYAPKHVSTANPNIRPQTCFHYQPD